MDDPRRPDLQAHVAELAAKPRKPDLMPEPMAFDPMPDTLGLRNAELWREAMPSRFLAADLADLADQPELVRRKLADWASNPHGRNVLLWGPVGCGKTHAAVAACRLAHFDRHQEVLFRPVVELLDDLRPSSGDLGSSAYAEARDVDVLVLDDLGGERPTDWTAERLYAVVNRRWMEERPIVGTTNLPLTDKVAGEGYTGPVLEDVVGARTFSRLVGNGAVVLRMAGPDRRR